MQGEVQQSEYLQSRAEESVVRGKLKAQYSWLAMLTLLVVVVAAIAMHRSLWQDDILGRDIKSIYEMSHELSAGINPYERILPGQRSDGKFAIYLPLFYILGALLEKLGFQSYEAWIGAW